MRVCIMYTFEVLDVSGTILRHMNRVVESMGLLCRFSCSGKWFEAMHVIEGLPPATVCCLAAQVTSVVLSLLHERCHSRPLHIMTVCYCCCPSSNLPRRHAQKLCTAQRLDNSQTKLCKATLL